jgi:hypothetical protein
MLSMLCASPCNAAAGAAPLYTKFFQLGMDGLCSSQATYAGITASFGKGVGGTYGGVGPISTSVSFYGAAGGCPPFGPSASPHLPLKTSPISECWGGAASSMLVELNAMCELGGAAFYKVVPPPPQPNPTPNENKKSGLHGLRLKNSPQYSNLMNYSPLE